MRKKYSYQRLLAKPQSPKRFAVTFATGNALPKHWDYLDLARLCFKLTAMLYALAALFAFQLIGEAIVRLLQLPFPGALLGALLLLVGLLLRGKLPTALEHTAQILLQNMMLLFIPTIAGVMLHFDRIAKEWQPFLVAGVAGAAITFAATALTFKWMLAREPKHAQEPQP